MQIKWLASIWNATLGRNVLIWFIINCQVWLRRRVLGEVLYSNNIFLDLENLYGNQIKVFGGFCLQWSRYYKHVQNNSKITLIYFTKHLLRKFLLNFKENLLDRVHFWQKYRFSRLLKKSSTLDFIMFNLLKFFETLFGRLLLANINAMKQNYKERKIENLRELDFFKTFLLHFHFLLILFKSIF